MKVEVGVGVRVGVGEGVGVWVWVLSEHAYPRMLPAPHSHRATRYQID